MMGVFHIASSSLTVASVRLAVSAHNTANLSTEGVKPSRLVAATARGGGVQAHVASNPLLGVSGGIEGPARGVSLAREMLEQSVALASYRASAALIKTSSELATTSLRTVA